MFSPSFPKRDIFLTGLNHIGPSYPNDWYIDEMSCSDFKSGTTNLRGMKRKLDMKLNGDRLRKQLTKSPSPPPIHRSKLNHQPEAGQTSRVAVDPLHHHNYHHQLKSPGDQLLCRLRQTMFNISLAKLSRYRHLPDPSLLRSVMICNTLKRLEKDLEQEGIKVSFGPNGVYFIPNNTQTSPSNPNANSPTTITTETTTSPSSSQCLLSSTDPSLPNNNVPSHNPSSFDPDDENSEDNNGGEDTFLLDLDSGGRVTPFRRKIDFSNQDSHLESSHSRIDIIDSNGDVWNAQGQKWSSSSENSYAETSNIQDDTSSSSDDHLITSSDESQSDFHELQPVTHLTMVTELCEIDQSMRNATLSSPDPVGSFGPIDIDVTQYDFDVMSPISPPNMRLTPVSAEELLKSVVLPNGTEPMETINIYTMSAVSMSSSVVSSSQSSMTVSSSSCATQSTQSMISNSKQYYCKKDTLFIDDCPTAIS